MIAARELHIIEKIRRTIEKAYSQFHPQFFKLDERKLIEEIMKHENLTHRTASRMLKLAKGGDNDGSSIKLKGQTTEQRRLA